ncbi:DUF6527 family protein [Bradyrhizobium barranii subsp. apii]|uniref:DUF6527 family protein n=1 Tax=Bradyrhizobium barranii subsp. apii TaxID=2819348 RepID=A0A8T5VEU1_9BRAD|nr:DUF6527 family protein [Bradyrhizobium barranii]UPT89181.1 DUF6527 family protein [Bradyrhizobium barranii subsp. apii]
MTLWHQIVELWLCLLTRLGFRTPTFRTVRVVDIPDKLRTERLYVAGEDGYAWTAAMLCPCGCGKVLEMNLLPDAQPCWTLTETPDGLASLHPSVWLKRDCEAHFWLQKGKVRWV